MWDGDRNGRLTEGEFTKAWNAWGRGAQPVAFGTLDQNRDAHLDRSEFVAGFTELGRLHSRWDNDRSGWLSEDEFNTGLFGVWDRDSNGVLAENEFDEYADDGWF